MRRGLGVLVMAVWIPACAPTPESTAIDAPPLRAFGNEPFWNVELPVEGDIVYSRLGEPGITFPRVAPTTARDSVTTLVYGPVADSSGNHAIEVRIVEEDCPDTMADVVHPMRATAVVDGETLHGCARPLGDVPGERP